MRLNFVLRSSVVLSFIATCMQLTHLLINKIIRGTCVYIVCTFTCKSRTGKKMSYIKFIYCIMDTFFIRPVYSCQASLLSEADQITACFSYYQISQTGSASVLSVSTSFNICRKMSSFTLAYRAKLTGADRGAGKVAPGPRNNKCKMCSLNIVPCTYI